ncbi:histidine kinase [Anaerolineales bacterium HSG6]|nr:histidine kinase [Anaerolineales bacterium HSG6]MDM8530377.1 histidine kinase [Anaerolineales bacterium HSG25]
MNESENLSIEQVIEQTSQEYEQIQKELKELDVLIQQNNSEAENLTRRNAQLTNQVRNIDANLDTMPRDDIRNTYRAAQETQLRLMMTRGQIEQLSGKQDSLKRYSESLRKVLDVSGSLADIAPDDEEDADGQASESSVGVVKIIDAQEGERRSLANQLHDGPAQALTNLILQAEICERLFDSDPSRARTELTTLKDAVSQTFQKVREFIFELRPMMLDDLGLTPTLKKLFEDYEEKHNIPCNFRVMGEDKRIPPHAEVTIFRVVQQLIKNAQQHANPTQLQISLDIGKDRAKSIVEDDGSGFDFETAMAASRQRKTIGLRTMEERVEMLGGELDVDSSPGRGTRAEFWIPTV